MKYSAISKKRRQETDGNGKYLSKSTLQNTETNFNTTKKLVTKQQQKKLKEPKGRNRTALPLARAVNKINFALLLT